MFAMAISIAGPQVRQTADYQSSGELTLEKLAANHPGRGERSLLVGAHSLLQLAR